MSTTLIIDPTGGRGHTRSAAPAASTVSTLDGLRIGLLENGKRNAAAVLDSVAASLGSRASDPTFVTFTKHDFAMPLGQDLVDEIARTCDVVVVGVGDCGSCSAAAIADGIALEAAGVPSAVLCTEAFAVTSQAMADHQGRPDFRYLLVEHPIANLTPEQIAERGAAWAGDVHGRLVGSTA